MPEHPIVRIALLGPESTGSHLGRTAGGTISNGLVPEFARTYLATLDHPYTAADVLHCFQEQVAAEDGALRLLPVRLLFFDTEIINLPCLVALPFRPLPFVRIRRLDPSLRFYLLTYPDIAFRTGSLGEHPGRRLFF